MKVRVSNNHFFKINWLFISYVIFKIVCDYSFWTLLQYDTVSYRFDFSFIKWLNGFVWCGVLFFLTKHKERLASTFFLYLILITQIVPLATIYALSNESVLFFNLVCFSYMVTVCVVNYVKPPVRLVFSKLISRLLVAMLVVFCVYVLFLLFYYRGLPTLSNLDLYSVYKFRQETELIGKYWSYLFHILVFVTIPIGLTLSIKRKNYYSVVFLCAMTIVMFLYTGHKTIIFSLPLVLICAFFSEYKGFYKYFFLSFVAFFCIAVIAAVINIKTGGSYYDISYLLFNFIIRREFFVPANLKFLYYDYFSMYEKIGFYGMFPRFLVEFSSRYSTVSFPNDIGAIYFNAPLMHANTGYLAEGYARFGYIGIFVEAFIVGRLLQLMDLFQKRTSYGVTIGFFVYVVFSLNDTFLLASLLFGVWAVVLIILLIYKSKLVEDST